MSADLSKNQKIIWETLEIRIGRRLYLCISLRPRGKRSWLDFTQALHVADTGNFSQAGHDAFEVLHILDINHHIDGRLAVGGAGLDVADVGVVVTDYGCELFQHSRPVIAKNSQLYGIS